MKTDNTTPTPAEREYITVDELRRRLPVSRRTIWKWRMRGLPFVRLPGTRKVLFHWPTVEKFLSRCMEGYTCRLGRPLKRPAPESEQPEV